MAPLGLIALVLSVSFCAGAPPSAEQLAGQQYRTTRVLQLQVTTTGALSQALAKTWKTTNSIVVVLGPQSSPSWAPPALLVDKALELGPGQSLVLTTPAALLSAQTAKAKPGSAGAAIARSALLQVNCEASDTGGFLSARDAASVELRGLSIQRCPGPALVLEGGGRLILQDVELAQHNLEMAAPSGAIAAQGLQQVIMHRLRCGLNKATVTGGCMHARRIADVQVSDSVFLANMKDGNNNAGGGAALAIERARSVTILNSTFKHNWSFGTGSKGGAVLLEGIQRAVLRACVFEDCTATEQGGAVHVRNPTELLVEGCNFTGNGHIPREVLSAVVGTADIPKTGAGLDLEGASPVPLRVTVRGCRFDGNIARSSAGMSAMQAGPGVSNIIISHCTFFNNSGSVENAGLGVGASVKGVLQVLHSDFVSNIGARGAAMGVGMQELLVSDTRFIGNKAFREGGAVMTDCSRAASKERSTNAVFQHVLFANNSCSRRNGGLLVKHQYLLMQHVRFIGNLASTGAGALSLLDVPNATLDSVTFVDNRATAGVGGLSARNLQELLVHNATFQSNKGLQGGALGLSSVAAAQLKQLLLLNNTAQDAGGAMAVQRSGAVRLSDSQVVGNTAAVGGGLAADSSTLMLTRVLFDTNSAQHRGSGTAAPVQFASAVYGHGAAGGAVLQKSDLHLVNCRFDANVADSDGGALLFRQPRSVRMDSCSFSSNSAVSGSGGAVALRGLGQQAVSTNMSNCSFTANRAAMGSGGAVLLDSSLGVLLLRMQSCTFVDNAGGTEGGALAAVGPCQVSCSSCTASNNTADAGGWASCRGCSRLATDRCRLERNRARRSAGGALQCSSCAAVEHYGDTHIGNRAAAGGAVAMQGVSQARIEQCAFDNNAAEEVTAAAKLVSAVRAADAAAAVAADVAANPQKQQQQEQRQLLAAVEEWPAEWQSLCSLSSLLQPSVDATCATEGAGGAVCLNAVSRAVVVDSAFSSNAGGMGGALLASSSCPERQQQDSASSGGSRGSSSDGNTSSSEAVVAVGGGSGSGSALRQAGSCLIQLLNNSITGNAAREAGGALYTTTPSVLQLSQKGALVGTEAAAHREQPRQQPQQQQQEVLDQLADSNAVSGIAYGPGAASAPAKFSLLPGQVTTATAAGTAAAAAAAMADPAAGKAAATTAATAAGTATQRPKRRSLLHMELLPEAGMGAGRASGSGVGMQDVDLQQTCPDLGLAVVGPQHAEVDSYQPFSLPLFLRDAFGSLVTSGPGNKWAVGVKVAAAGPQAATQTGSSQPSKDSGSAGSAGSSSAATAAPAPAAAAAVQLVGASRGQLKFGALVLDGLSLNAPPASQAVLSVTGGPTQARAQQALTTYIKLTARPCLPGQSAIFTPGPNSNTSAQAAVGAAYAGASQSNVVCVLCPAPSFSFSAYVQDPSAVASMGSSPESSQLLPLDVTAQHSSTGPCQACPPLGVCVAGMLVPAQGAYHPHPRSATLTPCPMTKACQRDAAAVRQLQAFQCQSRRILDPAAIDAAPYAAAQCSSGYAGPLCSSCYRPGRNRQLQQQQQLLHGLRSQSGSSLHAGAAFSSAAAARLAVTDPLLAASIHGNSSAASSWQHAAQPQVPYGKSSGRCLPCMHAAVAWLLFVLCRLLDAALITLLAALWLYLGQLSQSPAAAALEALEAEWRQKQHAAISAAQAAGRVGHKPRQQQGQGQVQGQGQADTFSSIGAASGSSSGRTGSSPGPVRSGYAAPRVSFSGVVVDQDAAAAAGFCAGSSGAAASGAAADTGNTAAQHTGSIRPRSQHRLIRSKSSQSSLSTQADSGLQYNLVQSVSLMFAGAWELLQRDSAQQAAAGASHIWQSISSSRSSMQQQERSGLPGSCTSSAGQLRMGSGSGAVLAADGGSVHAAQGPGLPSYPSIVPGAAFNTAQAPLPPGQPPAATVWHTATGQDLSVFQLALQQQQPAGLGYGPAASAGFGLGPSHAHSLQQQEGPDASAVADAAAEAAAAAAESRREWRRKGVLLLALRSLAGIVQVVLDGWQLAAIVLSADLLLNLPNGIAQGLSAALITQQTTWQWVPFDCLLGPNTGASGAAVQSLLVMLLPFFYAALLLPLVRLVWGRPGADTPKHASAAAAATEQLSSSPDLQAPQLQPAASAQHDAAPTLWTQAVALLLASFSYCAALYISTIIGAFTCMPRAEHPSLPGEVHLQHTAWSPDLQLSCWQGQHWLAVLPVLLLGCPALLAYLLLLLALSGPESSTTAAEAADAVHVPQQQPSGQQGEHMLQQQQQQDQHLHDDHMPGTQQQHNSKQHDKQPSCLPSAEQLPAWLTACWVCPVTVLRQLQSFLTAKGVTRLSCSPCQLWKADQGWWWVAARECVKAAVLAGFWGCALRVPRVQGLVLLLLVLLAAVVGLHAQAASSVRMEQWQYGCGLWVVLLAWLVVLFAVPGVEGAAMGGVLLGVVVVSAVLAAVVLGQHVWHVLLVAAPLHDRVAEEAHDE